MGLKIDSALLSQRRSKEIQRRKVRIQVQNTTWNLSSGLEDCGVTSRGHSTSQERCISFANRTLDLMGVASLSLDS